MSKSRVADSDGGILYGELCGLPIVPSAALSKGCLTIGAPTDSINESVLVATAQEAELLAALQADIVDPALPSAVLDHLRSEAMTTYTNVKVMTAELVAVCLERVLPEGWKGIDEVQWRAGKDGQPEGKWMREFWEYASEDRLGAFRDWPLLPTCEGTLCALANANGQGTKVVDGAAALSERVQSVLSRLGVRMLDLQYMNSDVPERLSALIQLPTLRGVLRALGVANSGSFEHVCQRIAVLPASDKRELRAFFLDAQWMARAECSAEAAAMVLALPIHDVCVEQVNLLHDPGIRTDADLIAIDSQKLPPRGANPSLLTAKFVRASASEEEAYRFLGVATSTLSDYFVQAVFPRLSELDSGVCMEAMLSMMEQMPQLCREDARFWDRLAHLAFVTTGSGQLARPAELYDPSVAELQDLLEGGEFYPAEAFLRPELVSILIRLGLKTSLNRGGVLKIATRISEDGRTGADDSRARKRASALLRFLDAHYASLTAESTLALAGKHAASGIKNFMGMIAPGKTADVPGASAVGGGGGAVNGKGKRQPNEEVDVETFKQELLELSWVPVLTEAPFPDLPWTDGRSPIACPRDVRPRDDLWLLSFFSGIMDGDITSQELRRDFGWSSSGDRCLMAAQLVKLTQIEGLDAKAELQEPLNASVLRMYSSFQAAVGTDELEAIRSILEGSPWVWLGDAFSRSGMLAHTAR